MKRRLFLTLFAAALLLPSLAFSADFDHGYAAWDRVLRAHVDGDGRVAYRALAADADLAAFLASVGSVPAEAVAGWTRDQQVAFYINAYNALTFQTIVKGGIPSSIRELDKPWETEAWTVAGRTVSLNWIEHTKLRGQFGEERVHFVLVCAAVGCPRLPNRAITPDGLSAQLDKYTRGFFNDPARNRIDGKGRTIHLSKIVEWYGKDFVRKPGAEGLTLPGLSDVDGAVVRYAARFWSDESRAMLAEGAWSVVHDEYDWALNKQ
jgi:hypothetical protein